MQGREIHLALTNHKVIPTKYSKGLNHEEYDAYSVFIKNVNVSDEFPVNFFGIF